MKHQKPRWFTAFAIGFVCLPSLLAFSLYASAAPENNQKVFRFNISPSGYPPYMIVGQDAPSGIMWDVVALISERLGCQIVAKNPP
jgi:polar amino acid transport system substrate-binding protein